jgi:thiosulfate/3-mercaptopyruvate sulfurtransferase
MADYAYPEVLVSTAWVAEHLYDPNLRLIEVDVDTSVYERGHIRGAVGWNWQTQLQDQLCRNLVTKKGFEKLCRQSGISNNTTVILYGDNNNWFAAWAFWQFKYYGHDNKYLRLMNGGRKKWELENRELVTDIPKIKSATYKAKEPNTDIRAKRGLIFSYLSGNLDINLVDVRSVDEFTGKVMAPPGMMETAQRRGHIPGAKSIPWLHTVNEDGSFKSANELKALYEGQSVTNGKETITYCRMGERSSHSWFALKYLLGYPIVKNYDGSWAEWGNLVEAPIEK